MCYHPWSRRSLCPDHFKKRDWETLGPAQVTKTLPENRVVPLADTVAIGDFSVIPTATPHAGLEHYSYLLVWNDLRLYFVGDTERPDELLRQKDLDIAFVTPWLGCRAKERGESIDAKKVYAYHVSPSGRRKLCNEPIQLERDQVWIIPAGGNK